MGEKYETFYDEIKQINGVLRITIPIKLAEAKGFKEGNKIKALIKKE